jgi:uncharacterized damage-inducible protein DinB
MKELFEMYAKYLEDKDKKIGALLDKLSNEDREKNRGSYFGSVSGLYRHTAETLGHLGEMAGSALPVGSAAKAVKFEKPDFPDGVFSEAQWKECRSIAAKNCALFRDFVSKLSEEDLNRKAKWFSGDMVPVYYMLAALCTHQVHHQGAISQLLDEMKIDNDFSGISPKFI